MPAASAPEPAGTVPSGAMATSRLLPAVLTTALLLAAAPAVAAPPLAFGARAGTTGLGVDVTGHLTDRAHLRLAASTFGFDTTLSSDDVDYDADAEVGAALLLLDWYPGAGAFRVSLGGGWNGTEAEVSTPLESFVPEEYRDELALLPPLGTVTGLAQGDDFVPALLLGWGNPFRGGRWNLSFEIGAYYQGEPEVGLGVSTDLPIDQIPGGPELLSAALEEEERELEEELRDYTVVPVVSFTLSYRFGGP